MACTSRRSPTARRSPSDMAMQLLGALFEYELARRGGRSTSSARPRATPAAPSEYAMRGKKGVKVFMLSPHGRMSPFQQAQMFSLRDANIHNIAIEGVFDDRQDIVKAVSERPRVQAPLEDRHRQLDQLGAPAGPGRLLLRRLLSGDRRQRPARHRRRAFGQHLRQPRGAPDGHAIRPPRAGHQRNDVLDEFFRTGTYRDAAAPRPADLQPVDGRFHQTGNFRLLFVFDLLGLRRPRVSRASELSGPVGWRSEQRRFFPAEFAAGFPSCGKTALRSLAMPTDWPPSATPGNASVIPVDRHSHRRPA